jgi:hypothetical protein
MEKKEYEIGYVEITTQEYKDLITEAVEHRKDAEKYLLEKCRVERENKELREELLETQKKVVMLEGIIMDRSWEEHQNDTEVANNG